MGRAQGVSPGIQMRRDCETRLRDLVPQDEAIIAVGTAEELRKLGSNIGSGGGWTFLVVTTDRVLFARWGSPRKPPESIRLDEVTHWSEGRQYNCYVLVLTHPPITRRQRVAPHRFLWFTWGDDEADVTRTQTIFRFSRPETKAAKAIRASLEERCLPHELLRFRERSREERTGGSSGLFRSP
jgi:hypothetical protein